MNKIMYMNTQYAGVPSMPDMSDLLNFFYPVGCYYWTSDSTFNPNNTWGGTWVKLDEGIVLTSAGTNYPVASDITKTSKDGGATTSTTSNHTITAAQIPSHNHGERSLTGYLEIYPNVFYAASGIASSSSISSTGSPASRSGNGNITRVSYNVTHTHDSVGSGSSHNHGSVSTMQPYKNAYCWHRTA